MYATKTLLVPTMTVPTVVPVIKVSLEMERLVKVFYVFPMVITFVFLLMTPISCKTQRKLERPSRQQDIPGELSKLGAT